MGHSNGGTPRAPRQRTLRTALGPNRSCERTHPYRPEKERRSVNPSAQGEEIRALRQLRRDWPAGRYVFVTERGAPFTRSGLAKMVERAGEEAGFPFPVHFHMLRHACGYKFANDGQD